MTKAVLQWWRGWTRRSAARLELKCRGEDEVERMAKDVGVSASELRRLASLGPDSADLLLRRMAALDLDRTEVSRTEPQAFQDLQRVCTMCNHHRRCRRGLARDSGVSAWGDYWPNGTTGIAVYRITCRVGGAW